MKKDREKKTGPLGEKSPFMAGEKPVFIEEFLGGNLMEQFPELERLGKKALLFKGKAAKLAAEELLRRATEVQRYLGPVLMERPNLLADEAERRFDFPVLLALSPSHRYYYKSVLDKLRGLKLGSKKGIASTVRAKWKSVGEAGAWAVALVNITDALRTTGKTGAKPERRRFGWLEPKRSAPLPLLSDHVIEAYVLEIRMLDPEDRSKATAEEKARVRQLNQTKIKIVNDAKRLKRFGPDTVEDWIKKVCLPVLFVLRPELRPAQRGKRKQSDKKRTDPRVRRKRDAIVARIREMVAGLDKAHSWLKSSS